MGCIANGAILSEKWREMVNKVNKYEMTPEALYLLHHDKILATLVKQDNRIIGIRWQVKGYNVNGGVQFRSDIPNIWIVLKSNGSIEGEGECLPFIGTYQIDALKNSVKFNVRSISLERCSKNSDAWRRQNFLIKNINNSFKFDRTGNNLELRDSNGAMTISASS
ncbi:MAG: META domain-containing protein [Candidatus Symbiopectobacterium sp. Dall1.0]|nr:META domain-containing protein [Candidatus Symbiopectobacterium sp. Dall1.0]